MLNLFMFENIISPLDQFEIRNYISIDAPILANMQFSLTNIGFYLIISLLIAFILNILGNNNNNIISNNWSINQESIYATMNNLVINQISAVKAGQIYFPFIYYLHAYFIGYKSYYPKIWRSYLSILIWFIIILGALSILLFFNFEMF